MIQRLIRIAGIVTIAFAAQIRAAAALELITPKEAALPDADGVRLPSGTRGLTRSPTVRVVAPAPGAGAVTSPLDLVLKFESYGGATVEPASVVMTYLKKPALNLTQRI